MLREETELFKKLLIKNSIHGQKHEETFMSGDEKHGRPGHANVDANRNK